MLDRRKNRSDHPYEALSLYLAAATAGSSIRAVALAGDDGALLGRAGSGDFELLAAFGPGFAARINDGGPLEAWLDAACGDEDVYASRLTICDKTLYLTSLGARVPRQNAMAEHLARILGPVLQA